MRRWAVRIAVFVLAGAALNVLVAWGCALWSPVSMVWKADRLRERHRNAAQWVARGVPAAFAREQARALWPLASTDAGEVEWALQSLSQHEGPGKSVLHGVWPNAMDIGPERITHVRVGWPLRSLWCSASGARSGAVERPWSGGIPAPAWLGARALPAAPRGARTAEPPPLPLVPVLSGFTANTGLYAAAAAVLAAAIGGLRRCDRRRRFACAGCGYDLRGIASGLCPECGAGVRV